LYYTEGIGKSQDFAAVFVFWQISYQKNIPEARYFFRATHLLFLDKFLFSREVP